MSSHWPALLTQFCLSDGGVKISLGPGSIPTADTPWWCLVPRRQRGASDSSLGARSTVGLVNSQLWMEPAVPLAQGLVLSCSFQQYLPNPHCIGFLDQVTGEGGDGRARRQVKACVFLLKGVSIKLANENPGSPKPLCSPPSSHIVFCQLSW